MAAPAPTVRFGDHDDPDDYGRDITAGSQRSAAAFKSVMGLPDQSAARQERGNRAYDRLVQRSPQRYLSLGEAMDYGESASERAERYRQSAAAGTAAADWDDGCTLPGELTPLTYG